MIDGRKVVTVTPAGRRRYMAILVPYLLRDRGMIDKHVWWVNTTNEEDIAFIEETCREYPDFFEAHYLDNPRPDLQGNRRVKLICQFFPRYTEPGTVYVRFDDDICWIAPDALEELVRFRINNPEYFLVYPAIINNGRTFYMHRVMGQVPSPADQMWVNSYADRMMLTMLHSSYGEIHHDAFLGHLGCGEIEDLKFGFYILRNYEQVSINCISWLGEDFAKFGGIVGSDACNWMEEPWLTTIKPKELQRPNCIWGRSLVSHFAFHTQRAKMEQDTNLLQVYEILSVSPEVGNPSELVLGFYGSK